jgi:hypothetical protein
MMHKLLVRCIVIISLIFQIIIQPISYHNINNQKAFQYKSITLESIFHTRDSSRIIEVVENLFEYYRSEKDINSIQIFLNSFKHRFEEENILNLYTQLINTVMLKIRFQNLIALPKNNEDFLQLVNNSYPEYRDATLDAYRRQHTDQVIKMYYAFITERFDDLYKILYKKDEDGITIEQYRQKLAELKKTYYDNLSLNDKLILLDATIFHDIGYKDSEKVNQHGKRGAEYVKHILEGSRDAVYMEDTAWLIEYHSYYSYARSFMLWNDKIIAEQRKKQLLFLISLFDVFGKITKGNYVNDATLSLIKEYEDMNKDTTKENKFYQYRMETLLSPKSWLSIILRLQKIQSEKEIFTQLEQQFDCMFSKINMEKMKKVWSSVIRNYNICLFIEFLKLDMIDRDYFDSDLPKSNFENSAKLIAIISYVSMAINELYKTEVVFDTDIDTLNLFDSNDNFDDGLIKKRPYYEALRLILKKITLDDLKNISLEKIISQINESKSNGGSIEVCGLKFNIRINDDHHIVYAEMQIKDLYESGYKIAEEHWKFKIKKNSINILKKNCNIIDEKKSEEEVENEITKKMLYYETNRISQDQWDRIFGEEYEPGLFTIADRKNIPDYLHPAEQIPYEKWIRQQVDKILNALKISGKQAPVSENDINILTKQVICVLDMHISKDKRLCEVAPTQIYYRVILAIVYALLGYDRNEVLQKFYDNREHHKKYGMEILRHTESWDLEKYIKVSVLAGIVGLSTKISVSSPVNQKPNGISLDNTIEDTMKILDEMLAERKFEIDFREQYKKEVVNAVKPTTIVFFSDDIVETIIDLKKFEMILEANKNINIIFAPRNADYDVDFPYSFFETIITDPVFTKLNSFFKQGRFRVSSHGPNLAIVHPKNMSRELAEDIIKEENLGRKVIFEIKGTSSYEMVLLARYPIYFSQVVCREFPESITGLDQTKSHLFFLRQAPSLRSFAGFKNRAHRQETAEDGQRKMTLASMTTKEYAKVITSGEYTGLLKYFNNNENELNIYIARQMEKNKLMLTEMIPKLYDLLHTVMENLKKGLLALIPEEKTMCVLNEAINFYIDILKNNNYDYDIQNLKTLSFAI